MAQQSRTIVTPVTKSGTRGSKTATRWVVKAPQPPFRPLQLRARKMVYPPKTGDRKLIIHRRGPLRMVVGVENPQELRAISSGLVAGTLPERIFYKALQQRGMREGIDFTFQSSLQGGRLFLGGMVADFILPQRSLIIRIQGRKWHTGFEQERRDDSQRDILEGMGYHVLDLYDDTIFDEWLFNEWLRRHIDVHPSTGGFLYDPEMGADGDLTVTVAQELRDLISALETRHTADEARISELEGLVNTVQAHPHLQVGDTNIQNVTVEKIRAGNLSADEYIQSTNFVTNSAGFKINADGTAEFAQVNARGAIYATSGEIAGWTINASDITLNDATLASAGYLVLGTGNNIVRLDAQNATYRIWIGHATAGSAPFRVGKDGALTATDATLTGSVTATSGAIAGWTINADNLANNNATLHSDGNLTLGSGNDIVKLDAQDETYRLWTGNATAASAPFRVTKVGAVTATSATVTGTITATAGTIGGWTVDGDTLTATGIILDAANEKITVGSEAPNIIIDGDNKLIKSSNFSEGVTGFALNATNGHAEFQNATVRGLLKTHVTETSVQTSTSGTFIVNDASDVLIAEVAADDLTIDVSSNALKRNGMVYMSPDASRKEWMRITNSGSAITGGYRYTVSRDLESTGAFAYEAGESIITRGLASVESRPAMWGENEAGVELTESAFTVFGGLDSKYGWGMALWGTKQVNFGGIYDFAQTSFSDGKLCQFGKSTMAFGGTGWSAFGGWVQLEGTATQGPYLSVVRREGPGALDYTAYGRFGKLDGFLDYAGTDDIGIGLGELGDYLSWDKQNGLRIGAGADKTQVTGEYVQMPSVTSTERDALTASNGMLIYNTTTSKIQAREAGSWTNII